MKQQLTQLMVGLALAANAFVASADVVYDNSSVRSHPERLPSRNFEFGEEIILAGNGTWVLTNFQFEYFGFGPDFRNGSAKVQFRIYRNNGPIDPNGAPTPGTLLYDSGIGPVDGTGNDGNVLEYHDLAIAVPKNFTWTVQFTGLTAEGSAGGLQFAGLDLYQFPTIGQTYDDYWEKTGVGPGGWQLLKAKPGDILPINFGCRVQATYSGPPEITVKPESTNIECLSDTTVAFNVVAIGTPPLTYQWSKDGSPLLGETGSSLVIPHADVSDLGSYTVKVTNGQGSQTSTPAQLGLTGTLPCLRIQKGPDPTRVTVSWAQVVGPQWRLQHTHSLKLPILWEDTAVTPTLVNGVYSSVIVIAGKEKYFRVVNP
jgi:hypothetical protein